MDDQHILKLNLKHLATRDSRLADHISRVAPHRGISFVRSRSQRLIPTIERNNRQLPLHSLYDPVREADRLARDSAGAGFFVILGLGGGYHISPLLQRNDVMAILIIEHDT